MKLIKLQDKFILVSDETVERNNFVYHLGRKIITKFEQNPGYKKEYDALKKIIAGIPELPITDLSLLKEEDCKRVGYVDFENTHNVLRDIIQKYNNVEYGDCIVDEICNLFKFPNTVDVEFKTAQPLNDKMFSLGDIEKVIEFCKENITRNTLLLQDEKELWQSLQQTSWDVEVEMEQYTQNYHKDIWYNRPKITNNSIKVIKIL